MADTKQEAPPAAAQQGVILRLGPCQGRSPFLVRPCHAVRLARPDLMNSLAQNVTSGFSLTNSQASAAWPCHLPILYPGGNRPKG